MDTFTTMVGIVALFLIYVGEQFKAGVYLWLAIIFSIIFALRMAEPMFYMGTAGLLTVLVYRTFYGGEDVRSEDGE